MDKKISGFTLIEMLVGIVIGMIVVAAASVMMVSVLKSQKDITASARLNQELGAAMAVMSNEIRRAGFRICDVDDTAFECPKIDTDGDGVADKEVPFIIYNTSASDRDLEIFDDGDCILLRYNADLDAVTATLDKEELRGFRLQGNKIQIAVPSGADDVTCGGAGGYWKDLTDPSVINITGLNFSTTGSNCRNMTEDNERYWVVGNGATGMPCDAGTTPVTCTDLGGGCGASTIVDNTLVDPAANEKVYGFRQIRINLQGVLTRDQSVSKTLKTSIKVANPQVGKAL